MNLSLVEERKEYIIKDILIDDEELNSFLFSLGCYSGEGITVIQHIKGGSIVVIKDARTYYITPGIIDGIDTNNYALVTGNAVVYVVKQKTIMHC